MFKSFLIDLSLSGLAWALGWHPVYDYLRTHASVLYYVVSALHISLSMILVVYGTLGGTRGSDLILKQQGPVHERIYVWSFVLVIGAGFIVPFVCPLLLPVTINLPLSMGTIFAPLAAFLGLAISALVPALRKRDVKLPDLFGSPLGRTAIGLALLVYLIALESTLFLAADSGNKAAGIAVFLGLFLSYLPVRLFVFYSVTRSESRVEVVSLLLSVLFLGLQLAT